MIDVHAHIVLENTVGAAGPLGPDLDDGDAATGRLPCVRVGGHRLEGVRYRGTPFVDVDLRLAEMDRRGIDLQVLSPNPLTYFSRVDPDLATEFALRHNDALAVVVAAHPHRFVGLAQLPTQDPVRAVDELRRAVGELGLVGAAIGTDLDRPLDDPSLDPLYAACGELDVPLFLHPSPGGIDAPRRDDRLQRWDADLWLGFAYEEALAVATLVLGGVLDRHPELDVCVSHGGGATSWIAERLAHAVATRPWASPELARPGAIAERLGRLWWDDHVGGAGSLTALVAAFGVDHLVSGTNFAGWDDPGDGPGVGPVPRSVLDANARRLLRLAGTAS